MCRSTRPGVTIWPVASIDPRRRLRRDVAVDRRDAVALERDVQPPFVPAAGVDDLATANQHVEAHGSSSASRRQRRLDEPARPPPATSSPNEVRALLERAGPRRHLERLRLVGQQLDRPGEVGMGVGERAADRLLAHDEVERRDRAPPRRACRARGRSRRAGGARPTRPASPRSRPRRRRGTRRRSRPASSPSGIDRRVRDLAPPSRGAPRPAR